MRLHFGVNDIPYLSFVLKSPKAKKRTPTPSTKTTGDIAVILEDKYHVMETFLTMHGDQIARHLETSMQGSLESLLMGAPATQDVYGGAMSQIEADFKRFLSMKGLDGRVPGVPTQAALRGVSHRFKHPYARRAPRPSFIDTGQYQANFRAWVE